MLYPDRMLMSIIRLFKWSTDFLFFMIEMNNNFLKLTEVNKKIFLNNNEALNCKDICNMFAKYPDNEIELQISLDEIT